MTRSMEETLAIRPVEQAVLGGPQSGISVRWAGRDSRDATVLCGLSPH